MAKKPERLKALDILGESVKDLKRRGAVGVQDGDIIVTVPLFKIRPDGEFVRINTIRRIRPR